MNASSSMARSAALIGDPSRAAMLWSLMGGESRPASELALLANVSAQTASNHLRLLLDAGMIEAAVNGRNRFYRLKGKDVAAALESLAVLNGSGLAQRSAPELVFARTCYDHLAGEVATAIFAEMRRQRLFIVREKELELCASGEKFCERIGVDLAAARAKRRRFAYPCLDWSHRVPHAGGALGAALLDWLVRSKAVVRRKDSRAVRVTETGHALVYRLWGIRLKREGYFSSRKLPAIMASMPDE